MADSMRFDSVRGRSIGLQAESMRLVDTVLERPNQCIVELTIASDAFEKSAAGRRA